MPAAAVFPAPIAYIKVVAVKKLVVEFLGAAFHGLVYSGPRLVRPIFREVTSSDSTPDWRDPSVTVSKTECSKQAIA